MPETLVLLHGFAGTHRAWDPSCPSSTPNATCRSSRTSADTAPRAVVRPVTFEGCVADVLAPAPTAFALCGYSFGGRVAQHVALAAPERVDPADPRGDERRPSPTRRSARRAAREDEALAADDRAPGRSRSSPTAGRPSRCSPARRREAARVRGARTCCATTRAAWPRRCAGIGAGTMEPFWDRARRADDAGHGRRRRPRRQVRGLRRALPRRCCRTARMVVVAGRRARPARARRRGAGRRDPGRRRREGAPRSPAPSSSPWLRRARRLRRRRRARAATARDRRRRRRRTAPGHPADRLTLRQLIGQHFVFPFAGARPPRALERRIARGEAAGVILFARNVGTLAAGAGRDRAAAGGSGAPRGWTRRCW